QRVLLDLVAQLHIATGRKLLAPAPVPSRSAHLGQLAHPLHGQLRAALDFCLFQGSRTRPKSRNGSSAFYATLMMLRSSSVVLHNYAFRGIRPAGDAKDWGPG
ncbi:MAG: hypothetical protein HYX72_04725, partial [Acidobacteria bacterium]|nr:hypothetical protein [Acidobacteriota bacterium]